MVLPNTSEKSSTGIYFYLFYSHLLKPYKINKIILLIAFVVISISANAQWALQQSGVTSTLRDIRFINSLTGWICGSDGVILKTTNGGINWISQYNEAIDKSLYGIYPVNANVVYCVGWFETILKTTNGGINWLTLQNGPIGQGNCHFCLFFLDENTGWIGSTFQVKKTTNGGLNWIDYIYGDWLYDIYFKDSLNGIGVNGEAYHYGITTNGGLNWIPLISGEGNYFNISIMPYNKNIGFIINSMGFSVRKTTNFGMTFDSVGNIPNVSNVLYCSKFINENIGWAGGSYGQIYKTENGGKTWRTQNSLNESFIRKFYALNDSEVWACGGGGKIIYTTNGGDTITSIHQISSNVPDRFDLSQNYPNPFNPVTKINYDLPKSGMVKLVVYDILGREIKILVNEFTQAGKYSVEFDGSKFASGVYFYRIQAGDFMSVKKMLMIK